MPPATLTAYAYSTQNQFLLTQPNGRVVSYVTLIPISHMPDHFQRLPSKMENDI